MECDKLGTEKVAATQSDEASVLLEEQVDRKEVSTWGDVLSRGKIRRDLDTMDTAILDKLSCYEPLARGVFAFFPKFDPGIIARGIRRNVDQAGACCHVLSSEQVLDVIVYTYRGENQR